MHHRLSTSIVCTTLVLFLAAGCASDASTTKDPPATTQATSSTAARSPDTSSDGSGPEAPATTVPPVSTPDVACRADTLDVRDQATLLVFAGLNGNTGEATRAIRQGYGGIFVTSATAYEVADGTLAQLIADHGSHALVGIDQEGGRVARLTGSVVTLPSARQMHRTMTPDEIRDAATTLGGQLAGMGVTVDFAPSVDVSDQPDDSVIGDRSFSNDAHEAATDAAAFARGLTDAGVLPVFKHFPGHGHGSGDSHHALVTTPPLATLRGDDLVAFEEALAAVPGAAVMVGHLIVPGLTGDQPASVSGEAITGLLRDEMGFDGLVISDDLGGMAGIRDLYSTSEAAVRAVIAGTDLVLVPETDAAATVDGLAAAVDDGRLDAAQLATSAQRVIDAQDRRGC